MTVFIPDKGKHDISPALRFGQAKVVFTRNVFPDDIDEKMEATAKHAALTMAGYEPSTDYLCMIGSPFYISLCLHALVILGKQPIRLLRYDRLEGAYYPIELPPREEITSWLANRSLQ